MQSTFGDKPDCSRMTTLMLILFGMMSVVSCQWMIDNGDDAVLSEGGSCRIRTGGPGICTLLEKCDPYYKGLQQKTIQYSFLVRCSLIGFKEVICCPLSGTPTKPPLPQVEATTTTTTTTTTTMRPIVIGDVTLTGNEQFVDLSKILRRTSTSTTTTRRPRQNRLEPISSTIIHQPANGNNGINFQWPNTQTIPPQTFGAEWLTPNNQQEPRSQNIVQFPIQPIPTIPTNPQNSLTDLFGPYEFRPNAEDPLLAGASTLRTIGRNEVDEPSTAWSWSSETTPRTTTTSTTAIPDWIQPILPDWMKAALTSSTTQRAETVEPILPSWMQAALDSATATSTTIRATTLSPVIQTFIDTTTIRTVTTRNENERPSQAACRRYSEFNPGSLTFHILDGVAVEAGDFPHMGALIYPSSAAGQDIDFRCGSSLIAERYAMTAAHCVSNPLEQPTMVRLGVVQLTSSDDGIIPVDAEIETITMHPDYRAPRQYHDIALIRLRSNVEFTPYIRPACLYSEMGDIGSSTPLTVTGWGVIDVLTKARSSVLLAANVSSVPLVECNSTWKEQQLLTRNLANGLNEGQYCAVDPELRKDACQSDSGGPLQLVRNRQSSIVGVISFGQSCGSATPSVYARVAYYLSWIESVVWPAT